MIQFPYDFAVIDRDPDWRNKLYWPVAYRDVRETSLRIARGLIKSGASFQDETERLAYMASLRVLAPWLVVVAESAEVVANMKGESFASELPEIRYLAGETDANPALRGLNQLIRVDPCRRPLARQIAWTAEWSPVWRLPQALMRPDVIAFNRNPGLVCASRASRRSVRYDNVEQIYRAALSATPKRAPNGAWQGLGGVLAGALDELKIDGAIKQRALDLLTARYTPVLADIAQQLEMLSGARHLPAEIWAGTGGYWPSRIVGLEVMRRGGIVRRFDHGGNKALARHIEQTTFIEAAVSTHFVFASKPCVERWRKEPIADLLPGGRAPRFECLPEIEDRRTGDGAGGGARRRPRVMYATGQLKGFWQSLPAKLPNLVYVDWMMRLAESMQRLPIDLICRPHPGGIFTGKTHPLSRVAEVPAASFEDLLDDVDIIVIDSPFSRVMCAALESTKPVIYLDLGHDYFCDTIKPLIEQRCTVIALGYDGRGLPQVDTHALADAIASASPPDGDVVRQFRQLFATH